MKTEAPQPPRVHAPVSVASPQPEAATSVQQQLVGAKAAAGTQAPAPPVIGGGGAEVTAVVPGGSTPVPPVKTPVTTPPVKTPVTTPQVATPATPPGTELARTGLDAGPLLVLALVLVLLGVLLTRTASLRPSR